MTAVAVAMHRVQSTRVGQKPRDLWRVFLDKTNHRTVQVKSHDGALTLTLDGQRKVVLSDAVWRPGKPTFAGRLDGRAFTVAVAPAAEGFVIRHRAAKRQVLVLTPLSAELHERLPEKQAADTSKMVISPMPGLVVAMDVAVGQEVKEGEQVCIIEAMKMQNIIRAERDGVVKTVGAKAGDSVAADEVLVEFA
jgi:propionyl-CoA carboxylase alpha chain